MSRSKKALVVTAVLLLASQFVPVTRDNPPVEHEIAVPAEIDGILSRSCYDCHSNETDWPWYSRVAPVSWLIARDVRKGRDELNFSEFASYTARRQDHKLEEITEHVEEKEMPLWFYLPLHPDARLSDDDRDAIYAWVDEMRAALGTVESEGEGDGTRGGAERDGS